MSAAYLTTPKPFKAFGFWLTTFKGYRANTDVRQIDRCNTGQICKFKNKGVYMLNHIKRVLRCCCCDKISDICTKFLREVG